MSPLALLRCVALMWTGSRCDHPALAGTRRCGIHAHPPRGRARCVHRFASGQRCESRVPSNRLGVEDLCPKHRQPCANPRGCPRGRRVGRDQGLCVSCAANLAHEAARILKADTETSPRRRWEATFSELPRCSERSAQTGAPCTSNAMPDIGRCVSHAVLPAESERCTFEWDGGARCPKRWEVRSSRRCRFHPSENPARVGRPTAGNRAIHQPCPACGKPTKGALGCAAHAPRCHGHTGRGQGCRRYATVLIGEAFYCATHATRPVIPVPPPPEPAKPLCGASSGKDGRPCRKQSRTVLGGPCAKHDRLPFEEDRCRHVYDNGDRCSSLSRRGNDHGAGQVCALHAVPCGQPGCTQKTANIETRRCVNHRATCAGRATHGGLCGLPAQHGTPFCHWHQSGRTDDGKPRCLHLRDDGSRCGNLLISCGNTVWRELCNVHAVACRRPGCDRRSTFLNGLCIRHRARCRTRGCDLPALDNGRCWRHRALDSGDRCTMVTRTGDQCLSPGALDTDEGRMCGFHFAVLPPIEIRCAHEYDDGKRCCLRVQERTLFCGTHMPEHAVTCSWTTRAGRPCSKRTAPRFGDKRPTCEAHRTLPPDGDRCTSKVGRGQRCPGKRVPGTAWCSDHVKTVDCGVITATGTPCKHQAIVRAGRTKECAMHSSLPADARRCVVEVAPGSRCPAPRAHRRDVCKRHATHQPRCAAIDSRGVRCPDRAPSGFATCDAHAEWFPGGNDDPPDAYERFFLRPHAAFVSDLISSLEPPVQPDVYASKQTIQQSEGRDVWMPFVEHDPYDLTGAARMRLDLIAGGASFEEADRLAMHASQRYAENTIRNLTRNLGPYLEWCQDNHLVPVPGAKTTIARYLGHLFLRGRVWDGKPLASGTVDQVRQAIARAHVVLGYPDPFILHPDLVSLLKGYNRVNARPALQAHAFLLSELAALVAAARSDALLTLRDNVILTVLTDPEAGMNFMQAARWRWEHTRLGDALLPSDPTVALVPYERQPGFEEIHIPNRIAAVNASEQGFFGGEMPLQARLCGTAALRSLDASRVAAGLHRSGNVLVKSDGEPMTRFAIAKVASKACQRAGLPKSTNLDFDARALLLSVAEEPSLIALRDAAIMSCQWWGSLRRSEVSGLNVGDIGADSRGRGLIVLVRKSKTDIHGEYVPVPYARHEDGRPWPVDLATNVHQWLDAYARHLGRPLSEEDPLFVATKGEPVRLSEKSVGEVVKRWASRAGVQAELGERISSHGFRAGYATEWLRRGKPAEPLAKRQRRKSTQSLLSYFRLADPFEDSLAFLMDVDDPTAFDLQGLLARQNREGQR